MCSRYQFYDQKNRYIKKIIEIANQKFDQLSFEIGEIFPSNKTVVLILKDDQLEPVIMRWGFYRNYSRQLTINARRENLMKYFKDDYSARRCVVCCTGFYEWDADKKKHYISNSTQEPLFLASIYRKEEDMDHYCIITKEASDDLKTIHDRMPIVMDETLAIHYLQHAKNK